MNTSKTEEHIRVTAVNEDSLETNQNANEFEAPEVTVINEAWLPFLKSRILTFLKTPAGIATTALLSFLIGYSVSGFNQPAIYQTVNSRNIDFSNLNNMHLRAAGLDLSSEVRKFLLRWGVKEQQMSLQVQANMSSAKSDAQKEELWQDYIQTSSMVLNDRKLEFDNKFKQKINNFREELLTRLKAREKTSVVYADPTNPNEWRIIMDEVGELTEEFLEP